MIAMLCGCDRPPAASSSRQLLVLATLYPLADIARQVGGDAIRVDWLLDLGDPIDHYTLSRTERERITAADLVLCDGLGRTETWAQQQIGILRDTGKVLSSDVQPPAHDAPPDGLLYLDPDVARSDAGAIAEALARRVPEQAAVFRERAAALGGQISAIVAGFKTRPDAKVLVLSSDLAPFLSRLGVAAVGVDADPLAFTSRDADAVKSKARAEEVRAMLVPFDTPPGTLAMLEEQTGLRVFPIDRIGYPNFAGHGSYLDVLKYDVDEVRLATGQ